MHQNEQLQVLHNLTTSKGNQVKARVGDLWYKTDYLGYEGLSEYLCSELLAYTNITDYVSYKMVDIDIANGTAKGCVSENFLKPTESIITADRLFKNCKGTAVTEWLKQYKSLEEKIQGFVMTVEEATGLQQYGAVLTQMLEWDSFVLNDDRHFNNIAYIYDESTGRFRLCPLFDNGAAFLSDTKFEYPLIKSVYGMMSNVHAKPFSESFDKQVKACENLYGVQLKIHSDISMTPAVRQAIIEQYGKDLEERVSIIFAHQLVMTNYL